MSLSFPGDTNAVLGILSDVCGAASAAAAELLSPPSHPPIPLHLPNPLSSPAADKEQCIAAFTLCPSGR